MSKLSFLDLPREIRDQIYVEALTGPKRQILAVVPFRARPTDDGRGFTSAIPREDRNHTTPWSRNILTLLEVCSQIHNETKPLVFKLNAIRFHDIGALHNEFEGYWDDLTQHVKHFSLGLNLQLYEHVQRGLQLLAKWTKQSRNLKSISLIPDYRPLALDQLLRIRFGRIPPRYARFAFEHHYHQLMKTLSQVKDPVIKEFDALRKLTRRIVFESEFLTQYNRELDPELLLEEMHERWGGELWFAGRLCYKDGVKVVKPFRRTMNGGLQVAWYRPESLIWPENDERFAEEEG